MALPGLGYPRRLNSRAGDVRLGPDALCYDKQMHRVGHIPVQLVGPQATGVVEHGNPIVHAFSIQKIGDARAFHRKIDILREIPGHLARPAGIEFVADDANDRAIRRQHRTARVAAVDLGAELKPVIAGIEALLTIE